MALFEKGSRDPILIPVHGSDQIADVTGAGDTVIAALAVMLAAGAKLEAAVKVANRAAGVVVGKLGTAVAEYEEVFRA